MPHQKTGAGGPGGGGSRTLLELSGKNMGLAWQGPGSIPGRRVKFRIAKHILGLLPAFEVCAHNLESQNQICGPYVTLRQPQNSELQNKFCGSRNSGPH